MTPASLSILVDPEPQAAALSRVFVRNVLHMFGAPELDVEDVQMAVSDIVSGLIEAGTPIEIRATIEGDRAVIEGNAPAVPGAGPLLLGIRMLAGEGRWKITLTPS